MKPRPPIVAILGHVDHGKTTLLDFIRKSRLANAEAGGITQKIGAYEVETGIKGYSISKITFIDTPGHEAFTQLRARGAIVADIALLIIDSRDSVMPQTIESISHIKSAKIPYIVVLNKSDLPEANPERVKNDLLKYEVAVEGKGGDVPVLAISAKTGQGIQELLEMILLVASEKNFTYNLEGHPLAYIIETHKDKHGTLISAVIKDGHLKVGDTIYETDKKTKIRSFINDLGIMVKDVYPSTPFEILGFEYLPPVGSSLTDISQAVEKIVDETAPSKKVFDISDLYAPVVKQQKLAIIIKTESTGSLEAINLSLHKNKDIEIILKAVGEVNKSDIFLAKTTKAIVIGFNVPTSHEVKDLAKQENVIIKTYNIIYELLDELEEVANLLQEKEAKEKNLKGEAKVLASFIIEGEKICGVKILKGKINLGDMLELYRENKLIGKTKLVSLKNRAKTIQEAKKDQEAGMIFSPPLDIRIGDVVKSIL